MDVTISKSLQDSVYSVTISTSNFSSLDVQLFEAFGEPVIDIGGVIVDNRVNLVSLPSRQVQIKSQFPVTQSFNDVDLQGKAEQAATLWIENVKQRMADAMKVLRSKSDDFSGTETITI